MNDRAMTFEDTTEDPSAAASAEPMGDRPRRLAVVIAWSRSEPDRVGEIAFVPSAAGAEPRVLGRGPTQPGDPHPRLGWLRQRPGANEPTAPLASSGLSRVQLVFAPHPEGVAVRNLGRRTLRLEGRPVDHGVLREGTSASIDHELVLHLCRRPVALPSARAWPASIAFDFGEPDPFGIVGESPAVWALRDELAFAARRRLHVLLHGTTGTGKELAARAIHALGSDGPWIARNAATLPVGIADAELFGNAKDYPNAGMKERVGLVGAAHGGTLFLDEIAEMPEELQARLLRVLDGDGEYQRLGEERSRRSQFRLIGATNRPLDRLKHDVLARLTLHVSLPSLEARREDVPLIARSLVLHAAMRDSALEPFIEGGGRSVRFAPELVVAMLDAPHEHGVRGLATALWRCVRESGGPSIALAQEVEADLARARPAVHRGADLAPEAVRQALDQSDWVLERAYRQLGLKNRHVLVRLMKKFGIARA